MPFKSVLIYIMDHMRIYGIEPSSAILSQTKKLHNYKVRKLGWCRSAFFKMQIRSGMYFISQHIILHNAAWNFYKKNIFDNSVVPI